MRLKSTARAWQIGQNPVPQHTDARLSEDDLPCPCEGVRRMVGTIGQQQSEMADPATHPTHLTSYTLQIPEFSSGHNVVKDDGLPIARALSALTGWACGPLLRSLISMSYDYRSVLQTSFNYNKIVVIHQRLICDRKIFAKRLRFVLLSCLSVGMFSPAGAEA